MHNLHLIIIRADTPQDACDTVENEIVEWGGENNWRTICGCISEQEEIHVHEEDGRFPPGANLTLASLEKMIKTWASCFALDATEARVKFQMDTETLTAEDWWLLSRYCEFKADQLDFASRPFDLWSNEYRSWQLDENGLTNLIGQSDGSRRYVVFVDMHS